MKTIKKFIALKVEKQIVDDTVEIKLSYGKIEWNYGREILPEETFDTEEEAIEHGKKECSSSRWLILPVVEFHNDI